MDGNLIAPCTPPFAPNEKCSDLRGPVTPPRPSRWTVGFNYLWVDCDRQTKPVISSYCLQCTDMKQYFRACLNFF